MPLVCSNCRRELSFSKEPPRFCAFCGVPLPSADVTAAYEGGGYEPDTGLMPTSAPGVIGEYKLLKLLGAGGMGTVYEAEAAHTGQRVAVKLLSSQFTANPISVERFRQEGKLASQITHPRCVFVLAADTDQGRPYIVMELMPGKTLKDLVDEVGPLSAGDAIAKILDTIEGLQEAHRLGVIHRDVKPSNCFLMPDGHVKVGDFGLSKSLTTDRNLTQSGAFLGTVLYASPEQIRGADVGYASDVYSVCATLYYLMSARAPFEHESVTAALAKVISEDPPPLSQFRPDVPKALERVVMRGLSREPEGRYATLEELHDALSALVPSQLSFGGLWVRVGAFLLDEVVVRLVVLLPLYLLLTPLGLGSNGRWYLGLTVFPLYFVLLEGRYGASIGKRLLRLRVCKVGTADPPGYLAATFRTLIFYVLVIVTLAQPARMIEEIDEKGFGPHLLMEAVPFFIGMLLLVVPMRKSNDYRGLHEWLSGTCVLRLPARRKAVRLSSRKPDRLGAMLPPNGAVPEAIGPFAVRAASPESSDGSRILVAEDAVLGRRVVLWLFPFEPTGGESRKRFEVSRPARLRALGYGDITLGGQPFAWEAFVAPAGVPLVDAVDTDHKLAWSSVRSILEQLADEIAAAEAEGTLPETLSLQQVWVEPNGHAQLLDFVVPVSDAAPRGPMPRSDEAGAGLKLLAKVATLALEGRPRDPDAEPGPVRSAVPLYASKLLTPLMGEGDRYPTTAAFRNALVATRDEPAEVAMVHRAAQIGVQTALLAVGLLVMFLASGLHDFEAWRGRWTAARAGKWVIDKLATPEGRSELAAAHPEVVKKLDDKKFRDKVEAQLAKDEARAAELHGDLRRGPRGLAKTTADDAGEVPTADEVRAWLTRAERRFQDDGPWFAGMPFLKTHRQQTIAFVLMWPLVWTVGAYLLAGGVSMPAAGLCLRRRDGKKPPRELLALRALIVWLPVALILVCSVLIPNGAILWWLAVLLVLGYTACVLLMPERAPHDRALGLAVLPR